MAKSLFEEMDGKYERQGDYLIPCIALSAEEEQPIGIWGATESGLSEAVPQGYIHQSSYKRQVERLPCRHRQAGAGTL